MDVAYLVTLAGTSAYGYLRFAVTYIDFTSCNASTEIAGFPMVLPSEKLATMGRKKYDYVKTAISCVYSERGFCTNQITFPYVIHAEQYRKPPDRKYLHNTYTNEIKMAKVSSIIVTGRNLA